ncbi:MAG: type II toxin-antitoxin system VapC family toxin [Synergistaceae bacterium]|nr:type II toxin-antitoxin system VapC family toxin [Synergistaceae bacterium]
MRAVLFDTCILIDYLNGVLFSAETLKLYSGDPAISVITWMEVMVGALRLDEAQQLTTRRFLARFLKLSVNDSVAERAVLIRAERKIKLPDAIIDATAQMENRLLLTRNTRDFIDSPGVVFPYTI